MVLVAVSIASVLLVNKAREDSGWVIHTVEVENQLSTLLLQIRRAESAARGYLLTSGPAFLADHEQAVAAIIPDIDKLSTLTTDNPYQTENVKRLRVAIETRLDQFAREVKFLKAGEPQNAIALVREAAAGDSTATIRDVADAMRAEEDRLFALRTANADHSQLLASTVTIAGSALVVALAGLSVFLVRRSARARDEAEARLRDNNLNLEATVDERTADLREANDEIQRFAYVLKTAAKLFRAFASHRTTPVSVGDFQIDLKPTDAFNMDASRDWNRNSKGGKTCERTAQSLGDRAERIQNAVFHLEVLPQLALFRFKGPIFCRSGHPPFRSLRSPLALGRPRHGAPTCQNPFPIPHRHSIGPEARLIR